MMETRLVPSDWIYDNIFHFSEDQYQEYRDLIIEDQKRQFRREQISAEGNDPAESGEAYGTPHALASLYGAGRYPGSKGVPKGYSVDDPEFPSQALDGLGRPKEKASDYGTQDGNLGKDTIGQARMKSNLGSEDRPGMPNYKSGSPLALENINTKAIYAKNEKSLKNMFPKQKVSLFEGEKLLDEDQIREEVK